MYNTPAGNRLHIGIFGRRNAGKSSLINAITGQELAIVSDVAGTTTDPVYKSMEILPIGPCMVIDTAGIDDDSMLGHERIEKTRKVLRKTDIALLVTDAASGVGVFEEEMIRGFNEQKKSFLLVINKCDIKPAGKELEDELKKKGIEHISVSSVTGQGIEELKLKMIEKAPSDWAPVPLVKDIVKKGDIVVLVCPIDGAMPQGRLILPQVQVLREVLDASAVASVCKETELADTLGALDKDPALVITDSQVFEYVKDIVPAGVPLTSFSVLFARHKGDLRLFIEGVKAIDTLEDGDEILIAEACTHHVQPEDIGRSKIPTWLMNRTGKELHFDVTAGGDFPDDVKKYKLIIACGGCMVNRREMISRVERAKRAGVPITNYGIIIAYLSGIMERVIGPFKNKVF